MFDTPVDYETLAQLGSIMGSGGMVVMDEDNCMVDVARYFIEFTHSESCGKCIPCRVGLDKSLRILNAFTRGRGHRGGPGPAGRDGPHDPRHVAVRPGPDRAQPGADHDAALPPRVRGPHPRQALPRGRVRGAGAFALREQLPAAHEHPALPATLQEDRLEEAFEAVVLDNPLPASTGRVCQHPCENRCRRRVRG